MEFNGKSVDPAGHPAGRTDFYGIVRADLEDSLLYCQERMIAYTDRPVPLAKLGALSKANPADTAKSGAKESGDKEADDQPQLALIECYKNAVGISRKVDPILPMVLQQQRIEAEELLVYERSTGEFHVPGKGKVFLYDRSDNSRDQGMSSGGDASSPRVRRRAHSYPCLEPKPLRHDSFYRCTLGRKPNYAPAHNQLTCPPASSHP